MKVLVDTCIALWAQTLDSRLSKETIVILSNLENEIYFSIASAWEIEIKHSKHPDSFMINGTEFIENCEGMGYAKINIEKEHLDELRKLESVHNDPFDRMLISQAKSEGMYFLTEDATIEKYEYDKIIKN